MTFCVRAVAFLSLLVVDAFAQTNANFALTTDPASVSVPAGTSKKLSMQVTTAAGYSQPIYLMPGALPEGITLLIPSPVVGSQAVKVEVQAAVGIKLQTYTVAIYAAGGGENHSSSFSVTVLPEGMPTTAPEPLAANAPPAESPVMDLPADPPPPLGTHWVGSWGASAVTPSNESGAYYLTNVTVRQIVHLSIGTRTGIRLRLSNALGRDPVVYGAVRVAKWAGNSETMTSAINHARDRSHSDL
jgi:hypothetical protein